MNDPITQLGVGGILVYLVIKEMFAFLAKRGKANGSGDKSVEFWELKIGNIITERLEETFKSRNEEIRNIIKQELQTVIRRK